MFSGLSGSGKSTLAKEILHLGGKLTTEDVASMKIKEEVYVEPSFPLLKTEKDINENLIEYRLNGIKADNRNRYLYRIKDAFFEKERMEISKIFFLVERRNKKIEIDQVKEKIEKLKLVYSNIWRQVPYNISIDSEKMILDKVSALVNKTKFYKVKLGEDPKENVSFILKHY